MALAVTWALIATVCKWQAQTMILQAPRLFPELHQERACAVSL